MTYLFPKFETNELFRFQLIHSFSHAEEEDRRFCSDDGMKYYFQVIARFGLN